MVHGQLIFFLIQKHYGDAIRAGEKKVGFEHKMKIVYIHKKGSVLCHK